MSRKNSYLFVCGCTAFALCRWNKSGKRMVHGARNRRAHWMVRKEDTSTVGESIIGERS